VFGLLCRDIDRTLSPNGVDAVIAHLIKGGHAEWFNADRTAVRIILKPVSTVSADIYAYICNLGTFNSIYTLYELSSGDEFSDASFSGCDLHVILGALRLLEKEGCCVLYPSANESSEECGVKFMHKP
jgi:ESCRT-II complex subunit VPS25